MENIINDMKNIIIDELLKKLSNVNNTNLEKNIKKLQDDINKNIKNNVSNNKDLLNAKLQFTKEILSDILFEFAKSKKEFNVAIFLNSIKPFTKKRKLNSINTRSNKFIKLNNEIDFGDDDEYDEDYNGEEDEDECDEDDDDEEDDDEEDHIKVNNQVDNIVLNNVLKTLNYDSNTAIKKYFNSMDHDKKEETMQLLNKMNKNLITEPLFFKILSLAIPDEQKNYIMNRYILSISDESEKSDKLKDWIENIMKIPFGKYIGFNLLKLKKKKVKMFLKNLENKMDDAVFGHVEAKKHIVEIIGQELRNVNSKGNNIGIWGPPGNGKTTLVKEGIAKAMNRPFVFINLGGASDGSFLEGHSYTYEGSLCGRIADALMTSKCMNPIIYFDELDKISNTKKGEEITNMLIHLTDPAQNSHFRDKFLNGVDLDLSKATFIFSYNNPSNINRILLDRITQIETKYLLVPQKIYIAQKHLIPTICKDVGFEENSIQIDDEILTNIIVNNTNEGGIRKCKSLLYKIFREINIIHLTDGMLNNRHITFPFNITSQDIKIILKNKNELNHIKINDNAKCGIINGMYATDLGTGGILPIESLWFPSNTPLDIKTTGNLQLVIKESAQVAITLAFNHIDKELQDSYIKQWKTYCRGIHLHFSDGSVEKDGPSAGTAIAVSIYSLLTNKKIRPDIAITGEINLQGFVSEIGGLENKLEGIKRAGVKIALYPTDNEKDIVNIKKRNPKLICDNFQVYPISTLNEALNFAIIN